MNGLESSLITHHSSLGLLVSQCLHRPHPRGPDSWPNAECDAVEDRAGVDKTKGDSLNFCRICIEVGAFFAKAAPVPFKKKVLDLVNEMVNEEPADCAEARPDHAEQQAIPEEDLHHTAI